MEPTNTELSSRTAAIFSWLEFLGIVLLILSLTAFREESDALKLAALLLLLSAFIYKIFADFRSGRKKSARIRLIVFTLIITGILVKMFWP